MQRQISGFHQDETGVWVADLSCGHGQHVRHSPPWQNRAWVNDEQGRLDMLGSELDCLYCEMATLPSNVERYKQTPSFSEHDIPAALLRDHHTKASVWAEIVVEEGRLEYTCQRGIFVLRPGVVGIVEPEQLHHVRPVGPVRFHVRFCRMT
jgi:tellurite resistance-related uncharacterized protein